MGMMNPFDSKQAKIPMAKKDMPEDMPMEKKEMMARMMSEMTGEVAPKKKKVKLLKRKK